MSCAKVILSFVIICLLVGIGGMICAAYGSAWYIESKELLPSTKTVTNIGLWKQCTVEKVDESISCIQRDAILQFKKKNETLDIILMLVIIAGGLGIVSMVLSLTMCCIQRPTPWRAVASGVGIIAFLAISGSATAVVYAEMKIGQVNDYKHGWSSILAWVGCGGFILAFVLTIPMCCTIPNRHRKRRSEPYDTDTEFRYIPSFHANYNVLNNTNTPKNTNKRKENSTYENVGFQTK